jgi:VWFA-related protein
MSHPNRRRVAQAIVTAGLILGAIGLAPVVSWPGVSAQSPQQPVFRAGVDVTQIDVTVLDRNRQPIHGLEAANFSVTENGKAQTIVGVSEVVTPRAEDLPAAWLRLVPADVDTNFLGDRLRDSRIIVVVMDDAEVPYDNGMTIDAAKAIGRSIVGRLGPTDLASVVYTRDAGLSQDFTSDRDKLTRAIEAFQPRPPEALPQTPRGGYANEGDMQRHDEVNRWTRCEQAHPSIPTLLAVTKTLAGITKRRKTIIDITAGRTAAAPGGNGERGNRDDRNCTTDLDNDTRDLFSLAERANVNIYPVNPDGLEAMRPAAGFGGSRGGRRPGLSGAQSRTSEALKTLAVNTGGTAIVDTNDFETGIDRIFEENSSYYLVGYQSTDQERDGKFRQVDVHVTAPGATVLSRRGYYGPTAIKGATETSAGDIATRTDLLRVGLTSAPDLNLRVVLAPFALPPPASGPRKAAVVMTLGIREPSPASLTIDVVTVITSATADGGAVAAKFEPHDVTIPLAPTSADVVPFEWTTRLDLAPGRYEIRFNAHSKLFDAGASVYGSVEVPDFSRSGLQLSGLVFGTPAEAPANTGDPLATLIPVAPTSERSFVRGEHVTALVRIYQSGTGPAAAVLLKTQILDAKNASVFSDSGTLNPDQFDDLRSADYRVDMPTPNLKSGPFLLDIQALMPDGSTARREVPFVIR